LISPDQCYFGVQHNLATAMALHPGVAVSTMQAFEAEAVTQKDSIEMNFEATRFAAMARATLDPGNLAPAPVQLSARRLLRPLRDGD
jgi:hypothetical protein